MATTDVVFNGKDKTSDSSYSIRRFLYYWPVSNLTSNPVSATIDFYLRTGTVFSNKSYKFVLFKDIDISGKTNWKYRNANSYYQYPSSIDYYFDTDYYTNFCGEILATVDCNVTVSGTGDVPQSVTIDIPANMRDKSLWNNNDIFFGIIDNSAAYSPDLNYGRSKTFNLTLTCKTGPVFHYYDGSAWKDVKSTWYYNGTKWVEVSGVNYYNGSKWDS